MGCLQCQKELKNTEGKRAKNFCNSTCRVKYWKSKQPKTATKMKWVVKMGGVDISDKCIVDPKNWVLTLPESLLPNEPTDIHVDYSKMDGLAKSFTQILDMAKNGASREEVEKEIRVKKTLTPGQQDLIRRKIKDSI